jgi:TPR repeat protein
VVTLAALVAGFLLVRMPPSSLDQLAEPAQSDPEPSSETRKDSQHTQFLAGGPAVTRLRSAELSSNDVSQPVIETQYAVVLDPEIPLMDWRKSQLEAVIASAPKDVQKRREQAEGGDAESAFWMHLYFDYCRHQPKSSWQLDASLRHLVENVDRSLEQGWEGDLEWAAERPDALERGFRLCSTLEPDQDFGSESLEWLELAADLGHMGAQRFYHSYAREQIVGYNPYALAFRRPEVIGEFQVRADTYARAMLRTGHPQAFLLMARMLYVGDVYQKDTLMAYSYARAVENDFGEVMQQEARTRLNWIGRALPPSQLPETDRLARELLRRHGH